MIKQFLTVLMLSWFLILFTACSPKIVRETVKVYVPVKQECVTKDVNKPEACVPEKHLMFFQTKCLAEDRLNYENWGNELNAIVQGCK